VNKLFWAALLLGIAAPSAAAAQTAADSAAIRQVAVDYAQGWYAGDAARMERALHPDLAKRIVETGGNGRSRLNALGAMELVQLTRRGGGSRTPRERQVADIRILDVYHGAASLRVQMSDWVDYLHVARFNGRWVIVNALWEEPPAP
jgi:hypothetical protein